jgi:predicted dienelactone hydrolase
VEPLEVRLIEACQAAGLIVVFVAHDRDRFGEKYHIRKFKSHVGCDRCESLEAVVDSLESLEQTPFVLLSPSGSAASVQERPAADT